MTVWLHCQQFQIYGAHTEDLVVLLCHWYLLLCVLTNFALNCELYRFSANCYQADLPVYFFQHTNHTSLLEITHSHLNGGSSSEDPLPMPILTILQNPQVTLWWIWSIGWFIGLTGYLESPCFSAFFSDKTACFLAKVLFPGILANSISFLLLLKQIATNILAINSTHLFSYSSVVSKSSIGLSHQTKMKMLAHCIPSWRPWETICFCSFGLLAEVNSLWL